MAAEQLLIVNTQTGAPQSSGATESLFNAFYVFKYSGGVDKITAENYTTSNTITRNGAAPTVISNPTAASIVEWAQSLPSTNENTYGVKNSPYSWSDFIFCKWYGIIPNNRLVTLRKFPLGTNDAASVKRAAQGGNPQNIPVAQAVTWFGGPSGNDINQLWQNKWSLAWKKETVDAKNVQGNEVVNFTQSLVNALPAGTNEFVKRIIQNLATQADAEIAKTGPGPNKTRQDYILSVGRGELEKKKQEWLKDLYGDNGAFWNQINGPVNVKNTFLIRDRGLSSTAVDDNWELSFVYRTDSYFGMSQKKIALDIIANMLELTYSAGEWLQSLNIYYKNVGLELGPDDQALIEAAFNGGTLNPDALAKAFLTISEGKIDSIITKAASLASATPALVTGIASSIVSSSTFKLEDYGSMTQSQKDVVKNSIQVELVKALAGAFPGFLKQRASVADIPTGNWHLTIGNPMNPIMRIGNLVVKDCTTSFNDELGPDDFPTELTFKVTLAPTKPRDSREIRQMFNTGRIDYIESFTGHTADQSNSYGVINKRLVEESASGSGTPTIPTTNPSDATVGRIKNWLDTRYGTNMVNSDYLNSVYFYKPADSETYGGGGIPPAPPTVSAGGPN